MEHHSTILIVDDEPTGREILMTILSALQEEYNLAFASNGEEALARAAELVPDLILLDVMMPGMDGFEVCRRLRADSVLAEVPIIMVTALDDRDSRLQGIKAGADDFISKPFDRVELQSRVKTITRLNRYRQVLVAKHQLERDMAQLSTLYSISRAINYINDIDALLRLIVRQTKNSVASERASIIFCDEEKNDLYFRVVAIDDDKIAARLKQLRFSTDSGIAGWAFREGEPALVQDVSVDERFCREIDENTGFVTKSVLCIPLHGQEGMVGVLEAVNKKKGKFTEDDQHLLEAMADNIAVSIERATLYQELQETEELLRHQNDELSQTVEVLQTELNKRKHTKKASNKANVAQPISEYPVWPYKHILALVLSFIYCGLGQIYRGRIIKGISFATAYTLLIVSLFFSSPFPPVVHILILILMWFMGIIDVYMDNVIPVGTERHWVRKRLPNMLKAAAISSALITLLMVTSYNIQAARNLEFFSIQVVAFTEVERAKEVCRELLSTGYPARVECPTPGQQNWYRVLIGKFDNEQDAVSCAERLRNQNGSAYMIVCYRGTERTGILKAQL